MGFVRLMPYLFINKAVIFQPFYFIVFFIEDPRLNYIIFFLHFIALPRNFAPLSDSLFIRGPMSLYKLIFKII